MKQHKVREVLLMQGVAAHSRHTKVNGGQTDIDLAVVCALLFEQ
jgi:hypothetical protein